jgi:hypothetical protein
MRNLIRILILNFALLCVPMSANAVTVALPKTEVKNHRKELKLKTAQMPLYGLLGIGAGYGVLVLASVLYAKSAFVLIIMLFLIGWGLILTGIALLLVGLIRSIRKKT